MIEVIGGNLFQWDTGRVIRINTDTNIHEVHFTTKNMSYSYVVSTYEKDGGVYCEIPNILLQQEKGLICYEVTTTDGGEMTVAETTLALHKRNRPQDYAYTQDELKNFDRLAALIPTDEHINGLIDTKLDENIPTKLSQLTDDIGAGGAKITSVNGILPDENGNVDVQAGVQQDWNQNDSTAADYIKNRPFYTGDAVLQDIVPVVDVEISTGVADIVLATGVEYGFEVGKEYVVSIDGNETVYTAYEYGGTVFVGAEYKSVVQGSGYLIYVSGGVVSLTTMDTSLVGNHSIGIKMKLQPIIKVPEKYLPIATDDSYGVVKKSEIITAYEFPTKAPHDQMVQAISGLNHGKASIYWDFGRVSSAQYSSSDDTICIFYESDPYRALFYEVHNGYYNGLLGQNDYINMGTVTCHGINIYDSSGRDAGMDAGSITLMSHTDGSTKRFKITVDDSGTLTATEVS